MNLITKTLLSIYALSSIGTAIITFVPIYRNMIRIYSDRFEKIIALTMTIPVALLNGVTWPIYWGTYLLDEK
jgi:hypothetical protein